MLSGFRQGCGKDVMSFLTVLTKGVFASFLTVLTKGVFASFLPENTLLSSRHLSRSALQKRHAKVLHPRKKRNGLLLLLLLLLPPAPQN